MPDPYLPETETRSLITFCSECITAYTGRAGVLTRVYPRNIPVAVVLCGQCALRLLDALVGPPPGLVTDSWIHNRAVARQFSPGALRRSVENWGRAMEHDRPTMAVAALRACQAYDTNPKYNPSNKES